jgi:hypothetical protein
MTRVSVVCVAVVSVLLAMGSGRAFTGGDPPNGKATMAQAASSAKADYAMPGDLKPRQVWVTSVPIGLKVYYGASWKEMELKGKTPITIDRQAGADNVFVYSDVYPESALSKTYGPRGEQQVTLKNQPHTGVDTMMENLYTAGGEQETRLYIRYQLDAKDDRPKTIVALFQPSEKTLAELVAIYPKGNNFAFDDAEAGKVLAAKEVPDKDTPVILSLLHRGGRIAIKRIGKPVLYLEIGANGAFIVTEP